MIRRIVGVVCAAVLGAAVVGAVGWTGKEDLAMALWTAGVFVGIVVLAFGAAWGLDR